MLLAKQRKPTSGIICRANFLPSLCRQVYSAKCKHLPNFSSVREGEALNFYFIFFQFLEGSFVVGLALVGKDIVVFRFIIEYSSFRDFLIGP